MRTHSVTCALVTVKRQVHIHFSKIWLCVHLPQTGKMCAQVQTIHAPVHNTHNLATRLSIIGFPASPTIWTVGKKNRRHLTEICLGSPTCCHTETEDSGQTRYLTQSQYTDTMPASLSAHPLLLLLPSQLYLWGSPFEVRFLRMWPFLF